MNLIPIFAWIAIAVISKIVARVFYSLGVGYLVYRGINNFMSGVVADMTTWINKLPPLALNIAGIAKLDICINIWASAFTILASIFVFKKLGILR